MKKIEKLAKPIIDHARKSKAESFLLSDGTLSLNLYTQSGSAQWAATLTGGRLLYANALGWVVYDEDTGSFSAEYGQAVLQAFLQFLTDLLLDKMPMSNEATKTRRSSFTSLFRPALALTQWRR